MNKLKRVLIFLFYFIPITILNGMFCILCCNENIDEIMFKVSKAKDKEKISKTTRNKIIKEYLNNIYKK